MISLFYKIKLMEDKKMNRLMHFLEHKLAPFGTKVGNQRHLKAVRDGFMMAMPLVLVGSFFLLLISWPDQASGGFSCSRLFRANWFVGNFKSVKSINNGDHLSHSYIRYCISIIRII